ncbi:MAG: hypothetical protein ISS79_06050 [Phycisphaerae bacterium]|nr:hypothetical protein [Phycisphaerae bacterium]
MKRVILMAVALFAVLATAEDGFAGRLLLRLGPQERVRAGGAGIDVGTYSVPSFTDWDNDGKKDLIVGAKDGKVRIYINEGSESNPLFSTPLYAQSNGADLIRTGAGCMGCFPRVVYWDADGGKDLLIGRSDGKVEIFLNVAGDNAPAFDGGTLLKVGASGSKTNIGVGARATPSVVDWNSDGKKDLAVGAYDGKIHLFINEGTDAEPDFRAETFAPEDGSDLFVSAMRSSPDCLDLDGDGDKDLLMGNTSGQLLFYSNTGTDADPNFSGYQAVESDGVAIDLTASRSRPFACDWTSDGYFDVLIGASDGKVYLYQSIPQQGDMDKDYDVDGDDFAVFALMWGASGCGACGGADLAGGDAAVDMRDLLEFATFWLAGTQ